MKAQKLTRAPVLILAASALLAVPILVRTNPIQAAQGTSSALTAVFTTLAAPNRSLSLGFGQSDAGTARSEILPAELREALAREYGRYEQLVDKEGFLNALQTADI